jgi:hypothetical protein
MLYINVPITMVEIRYSEAPIALGLIMPIPIVRRIADIMEKSTAIPVEMIVKDAKSIDFSSFTLIIFTPRTSLWIFQAVRQ